MGFKIKANPTFPATIKIVVAGGETEELNVVFKHMRLDAAGKYFSDAVANNLDTAEMVFGFLESWDADEPLSVEAIKDLFQEKPAAINAIPLAYQRELMAARLGN